MITSTSTVTKASPKPIALSIHIAAIGTEMTAAAKTTAPAMTIHTDTVALETETAKPRQ